MTFSFNTMSQVASKKDSIDVAREMMFNHRIPEAILILDQLDKRYPQDETVVLLYSQALYWNNDFPSTISYIKKNTLYKSYPEYFNFHFGKILFELSYYKDANIYLSLYLKNYPEDVETLLMLAKMAYWQGKSLNEISNHIQVILKNDANNIEAIKLKDEISLSTAPKLILSGGLFEDSQPMQAYKLSANLLFYYNTWFQPSFQVNSLQYKGVDQAIISSITNKSRILSSNTELELKTGIFTNTWSEVVIPTWSLSINQTTFKDIYVSAEASKSPYLYTLASISENVVPTILVSSIGRDSEKGIIGKLMAHQMRFNDGNKVNTISAWFLAPIINQNIFSFHIGYAFTKANADQNRFMLDETIPLPPNSSFGQILPGVFNPYFTPHNQVIHAALGKIDIKFSKTVNATLNGNIGVHATIDNPNYVYYGNSVSTVPNVTPKNHHRSPPTEELILEDIFKIFVTTRYLPLDLKSKLNWDINRALSINTEYMYAQTIFFNNQEISLGLNWKFVRR